MSSLGSHVPAIRELRTGNWGRIFADIIQHPYRPSVLQGLPTRKICDAEQFRPYGDILRVYVLRVNYFLGLRTLHPGHRLDAPGLPPYCSA